MRKDVYRPHRRRKACHIIIISWISTESGKESGSRWSSGWNSTKNTSSLLVFICTCRRIYSSALQRQTHGCSTESEAKRLSASWSANHAASFDGSQVSTRTNPCSAMKRSTLERDAANRFKRACLLGGNNCPASRPYASWIAFAILILFTYRRISQGKLTECLTIDHHWR